MTTLGGAAAEPALPNADPEAGRLFARAFLPRDYQGGHAIHAITQGSDGLVYLGCTGAVVWYDGQGWSRQEVPGTVVSLAAGPEGEVFVATDSGFYFLRREALGRRKLSKLDAPSLPPARAGTRPSQVYRILGEYRVALGNRLLAWTPAGWRAPELHDATSVELYPLPGSVIVQAPGRGLWEWQEGEPRRLPDEPALVAARALHFERDPQGLRVEVDDGRVFRLGNGRWREESSPHTVFSGRSPSGGRSGSRTAATPTSCPATAA